MADNSGDQTKSGNITITVKTPKEKQTVEVIAEATVRQLKEAIQEKFNVSYEQICLIFAGRIIKDEETLQQHGIKDGLTVHLVIRTASRNAQGTAAPDSGGASAAAASTPPTAAATTTPTATPTNASTGGLGANVGLGGLNVMNLGFGNLVEMQQMMQREVRNNPELVRQMLDNPMIQSMMSNPDVMRSLILNNPQMSELMERNPEITHLLNNPEVLRTSMELARNPAMMQELMRTQDRAMSNLESIPGGFSALQRMYRDIQEPILSAAQDSIGVNPFSSLITNSQGIGNEQQGRENVDPLPNPWGNTSAQSNPSSVGDRASPGSQATGLLGNPAIQNMVQQMIQNPQMMNMTQTPYFQSMLQSLSANPELARQIIGNNPLFGSDPEAQSNFVNMMPTLLQQLQNPDIQSMGSNPRVLEALSQIQTGLSQLQQESPNLFTSAGVGTIPPSLLGGLIPSATPTTTSTAPVPSEGITSAGGPLGQGPQSSPEAFATVMSQMVQMMAGGQLNQAPEQRYASQLEQLTTMGFVDRDANIRALIATLGDVNAAIDRLLQQR